MTILYLYPAIVWAVMFPALIYLCWICVSADKQTLYLWIWILSPLLVPLVLATGVAWYPVKWTMTLCNFIGSPLYTLTASAVLRARSLVQQGGGK